MKKKIILICSLVVICMVGVSVSANNVNKSTFMNNIYQDVVSYVDEVHPNLNTIDREELIQELYAEKSEPTNFFSIYELEEGSKDVDEAYDRMMEEENYIVDLLIQCGKDASLESWESNLEYLKNNYEYISTIENIDIKHVDSYVEAYEWVNLLKDSPDQRVNDLRTRATYDYNAAKDYATDYYLDYNSVYPDWSSEGGDCANFVSQCLYAGGKSMKGTPGTDSAAQNWANWFSKGTTRNVKNVSSTWRGADAFRGYWQANATAYKKFTQSNADSWSYGYIGDAVTLLNSNGRGYHTMMIYGYSYPDLILTAHTSSTKTALLSSKISSNGCYIYNMR